jgi:hypothetical protein
MVDWSSSAMSPFKRVPPAPGKEWRGVEWSGVVQQQFGLEWSGVQCSAVPSAVWSGVQGVQCSVQWRECRSVYWTGVQCSAVWSGVDGVQWSEVWSALQCPVQCLVEWIGVEWSGVEWSAVEGVQRSFISGVQQRSVESVEGEWSALQWSGVDWTGWL